MELRESEFFGIRYDDRIGAEKIHSIFYNGSREEYVILSFFERNNTILYLVCEHLTVSYRDADRRCTIFSRVLEEFVHLSFYHRKCAYPIMEDNYLSTTCQFCLDRGSDHFSIPSGDDGLDRFFCFGRRGEE